MIGDVRNAKMNLIATIADIARVKNTVRVGRINE
jgi:hypothetical protein